MLLRERERERERFCFCQYTYIASVCLGGRRGDTHNSFSVRRSRKQTREKKKNNENENTNTNSEPPKKRLRHNETDAVKEKQRDLNKRTRTILDSYLRASRVFYSFKVKRQRGTFAPLFSRVESHNEDKGLWGSTPFSDKKFKNFSLEELLFFL